MALVTPHENADVLELSSDEDVQEVGIPVKVTITGVNLEGSSDEEPAFCPPSLLIPETEIEQGDQEALLEPLFVTLKENIPTGTNIKWLLDDNNRSYKDQKNLVLAAIFTAKKTNPTSCVSSLVPSFTTTFCLFN